MSNVVEGIEVFTLKEAAAFLRVSPEAVMRFVAQENLPGRQIEGQWRFLVPPFWGPIPGMEE